MSTAVAAKPNRFGVFEKHERIVIAKHAKGHASVATCRDLLKQIESFCCHYPATQEGAKDVTTTTTKKRSPANDKSDQVISIPLEKLHDHPGNPESTEAEIIEMMSWLQESGQDEPLSVRPIADPVGHYEVLAGKRRKAAATRLGWTHLVARVRHDLVDDKDAAAFAARNNIERRTEGDLRKAHWLRYQTAELGMTVADAASAIGMAQSTASNLMAIADMCDKFPYWRDLVIAGEMSAAHLRPLKKYRDYPAVMKLLVKDHVEHKERASRGPSFREELIAAWGTRESIEYTIDMVLAQQTAALTVNDMLTEEYTFDEPKFDAAKLTPVQRKKLKIVSIPAPGDKSDRMVERCFNKKHWQTLQQTARDTSSKIAADRSSKSKGASGSSSAKRELTPAELKKQAADKAKQLKARIQSWRHAWLKKLVAGRLDKHPLIVTRMRAWLQSEPFSGIAAGELDLANITIRQAGGKPIGYASSSATWKAVATLSAEQIDQLSLELIRSILLHEDRDPKYPRLAFDHVNSLALMASIDIAAEWSKLQQTSERPVEFETFFLLHDKEQLGKLATELKANVEGATTKGAIVKRFCAQAKTLPLPKSIAGLKKPAAKKVRGKK